MMERYTPSPSTVPDIKIFWKYNYTDVFQISMPGTVLSSIVITISNIVKHCLHVWNQDYNGFGQKLEEETTTTVSPPQPSPEITFVDLLKKARSQHRQRQQQADNQNILEEINRVPR